MTAYYNEHDPFAAAWLRELITAGHIAPGIVDERSIEDVRPDELVGYAQCHFFAGIGGWSHAMRLAGWPDDRPVWTGSCPCQPFSAAGKGGGFDDERHLWPAWDWLIGQCKPGVIFGEQVESAINHGWLDLVQNDLEGKGYAFGAVGLPAASVGAPHIRQRLWFVADASGVRFEQQRGAEAVTLQGKRAEREGEQTRPEQDGELPRGFEGLCGAGELGNAHGSDAARLGAQRLPLEPQQETGRPSESNPWESVEFIGCADGKARPTQPGLFPLAHGVPARVGRLRGYGNAIVPQVAAEVITAYMVEAS